MNLIFLPQFRSGQTYLKDDERTSATIVQYHVRSGRDSTPFGKRGALLRLTRSVQCFRGRRFTGNRLASFSSSKSFLLFARAFLWHSFGRLPVGGPVDFNEPQSFEVSGSILNSDKQQNYSNAPKHWHFKRNTHRRIERSKVLLLSIVLLAAWLCVRKGRSPHIHEWE